MKSVGEKFEEWLAQQPGSFGTRHQSLQQAFSAGHCAGAEHSHDEVHRLRDALEVFQNRRKLAHSLRGDGDSGKWIAAFVESVGAEMDKHLSCAETAQKKETT